MVEAVVVLKIDVKIELGLVLTVQNCYTKKALRRREYYVAWNLNFN